MADWSQACNAQTKRPLWQLQQANYVGSLFAVSVLLGVCALCSCCCVQNVSMLLRVDA